MLELSGGEQQRVNAAKAFSNNKVKVIPLDEPTASLDREHAEKLMSYIRSSKANVIYTTHREEETASADRVMRMRDGKGFGKWLMPMSGKPSGKLLFTSGQQRENIL